MNIRLFTVALLFAFTATPAHAGALFDGVWSSVAGEGTVTYHIVHKFHEVNGKSTAADARALVKGDQVQVQVRIPATSFTSGNDNRDSNAQAVVEAAKYPFVSLKGLGTLCEFKNGTCELALQAILDFHGVQKPYNITVTLHALAGEHMNASFRLPVVLTQHAIELPSLMFIPIDDTMNVDGDIEMERKP